MLVNKGIFKDFFVFFLVFVIVFFFVGGDLFGDICFMVVFVEVVDVVGKEIVEFCMIEKIGFLIISFMFWLISEVVVMICF